MDIKVPFIVTCKVTGLPKVYTSKAFVERKLANYDNDMQKMHARYVSKDARRELREAAGEGDITVDAVKTTITKLGGTTNPDDVFALIKAGELDLKKIVKRAAKDPNAKPAKKSKAKKVSKAKAKKIKQAKRAKAKRMAAKQQAAAATPVVAAASTEAIPTVTAPVTVVNAQPEAVQA